MKRICLQFDEQGQKNIVILWNFSRGIAKLVKNLPERKQANATFLQKRKGGPQRHKKCRQKIETFKTPQPQKFPGERRKRSISEALILPSANSFKLRTAAAFCRKGGTRTGRFFAISTSNREKVVGKRKAKKPSAGCANVFLPAAQPCFFAQQGAMMKQQKSRP